MLIGSFTMISNGQTTILQGNYSKVDTPFVFIARDEKTYNQLQTLVDDLPAAKVDFKKNAVVAVFAGEKSKGGYTIEIKKTVGGRIGIGILPPGKDMMSAQVISSPFKIVSVELDEYKPLLLNLPNEIISKMKLFELKKSDFEFVGGIAGRKTKFQAAGAVRMITFGDTVTLWFDLIGKGAAQKRLFGEIGSGTFKNGKIEISQIGAGDFVDFPRSPFLVKGTLKGKTLSLKFESGTATVADGYSGKGSLVASK